MKLVKLFTILLISAGILGSCNWNRTAQGGAAGTAAGGAVGAAIGRASGNTAAGAIFGAAVGGVAGASIGAYMDRQAEEMRRDMEGAEVERVGEGIKITFDSGILFGVDQSELKDEAKQNIEELAKIVQKYDDTEILIEGHTDNTGRSEYNHELSERRAKAVADYAESLGVDRGRMQKVGYGEEQPLEDNDSVAGRAANRRVEVAIYANKKLQREAKRGNLD